MMDRLEANDAAAWASAFMARLETAPATFAAPAPMPIALRRGGPGRTFPDRPADHRLPAAEAG